MYVLLIVINKSVSHAHDRVQLVLMGVAGLWEVSMSFGGFLYLDALHMLRFFARPRQRAL